MNEKQRLIEEIEQAPDFLVKEILDFLLLTKNQPKYLEFSVSRDRTLDSSCNAGNPCNVLSRNSAKSLKSLLLAIPDLGEDSDFERVSDLGRDVDL
jgi:hypothetical protein